MEYDAAVGIIEQMESEQPQRRGANLSVQKALSDVEAPKEYDAESREALIEEMERLGPQEGTVEKEPSAVSQQAGKIAVAGSRVKRVLEKDIGVAATDLSRALKGVEGEMGKVVKQRPRRVKAEEAVITTLSLQDQVSELEKISMGLDASVFSDEQLKIIGMELNALKDYTRREKVPDTEFERNLISVRNSRLEEALAKMKAGKG